MRRAFILLLGALAFFFTTLIALAPPCNLYTKNGAGAGDWFGYRVSGTGDVNGDGKADFIIGAPYTNPGGLTDAGSAYVYSGANGALLYQKNAESSGDAFGSTVAGAGDVNGDGKADFVVGAPYSDPGLVPLGSAYVYSGSDGALLYQKNGTDYEVTLFGYSVNGAGDVNGDGKGDFIISAPLTDSISSMGELVFEDCGSAYVYSGSNGALLYKKNGEANNDHFGRYSVAGAGDVNGDGKADFMVASILGDSNRGYAIVFSGDNGISLYRKTGAAAGDEFGYSVDGAGDLNGDGKADFIIGAPKTDPGGRTNAGSAYVYSGADGSLLYQNDGASAGDELGWSVAGTGDMNLDEVPEFIVGAYEADPGGRTDAGSAYVYSGGNGSLIDQRDGISAGDKFGNSVDGAGNVNGTGGDEFIVGSPYTDTTGKVDRGSAYVYRYCGLLSSPPCVARGDVTNDGLIDIADIVALIQDVVFETGVPNGLAGDADCDAVRDISDIILLIQYVVFGTPSPCCL